MPRPQPHRGGTAVAVGLIMTKTTQPGARPIDLREQLLFEHRALERLFDTMMEAFNANAREDIRTLWSELDRRLEEHIQLEERVFFPRFSVVDRVETAALQAEHRTIQRLCAELGAGVDLKLVRVEVARNFVDLLKAHAHREERVLYRWVTDALQGDAEVREWASGVAAT